MKRIPHQRYGLLAAGIAIVLLVALWPMSLTDTTTEAPGGKDTDENINPKTSNASEAIGDQRGDEGKDEIPTDLDAAENGALLNQQAMNAWQVGDIREAMSLFEQAVDAAPNNPAPHANYGRLLTLMTAYQQALPFLERARDLAPDNAQAWLDLATLYERTQLLSRSWAAQAEAAKLVGADALERADIDNVVGAYPFCGAMAGSRVWDGALDIRLTYDVICSGVVGPLNIPADIPGGATGLPEGFPITTTQLALAANACFGMLIPPPLFPPIPRTVDQQERLDRFLAATKIPENFIITDMGFAAFGMTT